MLCPQQSVCPFNSSGHRRTLATLIVSVTPFFIFHLSMFLREVNLPCPVGGSLKCAPALVKFNSYPSSALNLALIQLGENIAPGSKLLPFNFCPHILRRTGLHPCCGGAYRILKIQTLRPMGRRNNLEIERPLEPPQPPRDTARKVASSPMP
mmetsp:Transcript_39724/g.158053  ORF Transcript_39724/g.158053 Transcript_39724/m.158053 type:complete len:152 (+) Transcript_39724:1129-1584(+)